MRYHLIVPGLLGEAWPGTSSAALLAECAALKVFLQRADRHPAACDYASTLFDLFRVPNSARASAAFCYVADFGEPPRMPVFHADPVHLRPDRDRLLAFQVPTNTLSIEESHQFAAIFNQHFSKSGLMLRIAPEQRWYLLAERAPVVDLPALSAISGRSLDAFMPEGEQGAFWRRLLNETQMLFFDCPPNHQRQARGHLVINGLWFSGGGMLSSKGILPAEVQAQEPLARGLAICAEKTQATGMAVLDVELACQNAWMNADEAAYQRALQGIDRRLRSLMPQHEIWLYSCAGHAWYWQPAMKWRFWRRRLHIR